MRFLNVELFFYSLWNYLCDETIEMASLFSTGIWLNVRKTAVMLSVCRQEGLYRLLRHK